MIPAASVCNGKAAPHRYLCWKTSNLGRTEGPFPPTYHSRCTMYTLSTITPYSIHPSNATLHITQTGSTLGPNAPCPPSLGVSATRATRSAGAKSGPSRHNPPMLPAIRDENALLRAALWQAKERRSRSVVSPAAGLRRHFPFGRLPRTDTVTYHGAATFAMIC